MFLKDIILHQLCKIEIVLIIWFKSKINKLTQTYYIIQAGILLHNSIAQANIISCQTCVQICSTATPRYWCSNRTSLHKHLKPHHEIPEFPCHLYHPKASLMVWRVACPTWSMIFLPNCAPVIELRAPNLIYFIDIGIIDINENKILQIL